MKHPILKSLRCLLFILLPSYVDSLSSLPPHLTDNAPSWETLSERTYATSKGKELAKEAIERSQGRGPPHTDALLRLFDATDESQVRVTLFRDSAAWCPYCAKVWILLEEKKIPYRIQKVPMNAYGDKPAWYTRKVDGGKLPALELDGELHVESLEIMKLLDSTFVENKPQMIPTNKPSKDADLAKELLDLEKELQRDWFLLVFYPVQGAALESAQSQLLDTLLRVDQALAKTPGPWFLGADHPSFVDIQFIVQVERLIASALYWKGQLIRGKFKHIDRWLEAFESRPNYIATKSDYYTHVMAMPSQNGPGYSIEDANEVSYKICGLDGAWELPLNKIDHEPLAPLQSMGGDEAARHEAAYQLVTNAENIVFFACRGAGEPGRPSFHAELADPYAEPNYDFESAVDICLRHVTVALLDGIDKAESDAKLDLAGKAGNNELRPGWYEYEDKIGRTYYWDDESGDLTYTPPTQQLDTCISYLRDRIGVPRDMGQGAAMQLRAHLNWAIDILRSDTTERRNATRLARHLEEPITQPINSDEESNAKVVIVYTPQTQEECEAISNSTILDDQQSLIQRSFDIQIHVTLAPEEDFGPLFADMMLRHIQEKLIPLMAGCGDTGFFGATMAIADGLKNATNSIVNGQVEKESEEFCTANATNTGTSGNRRGYILVLDLYLKEEKSSASLIEVIGNTLNNDDEIKNAPKSFLCEKLWFLDGVRLGSDKLHGFD